MILCCTTAALDSGTYSPTLRDTSMGTWARCCWSDGLQASGVSFVSSLWMRAAPGVVSCTAARWEGQPCDPQPRKILPAQREEERGRHRAGPRAGKRLHVKLSGWMATRSQHAPSSPNLGPRVGGRLYGNSWDCYRGIQHLYKQVCLNGLNP